MSVDWTPAKDDDIDIVLSKLFPHKQHRKRSTWAAALKAQGLATASDVQIYNQRSPGGLENMALPKLVSTRLARLSVRESAETTGTDTDAAVLSTQEPHGASEDEVKVSDSQSSCQVGGSASQTSQSALTVVASSVQSQSPTGSPVATRCVATASSAMGIDAGTGQNTASVALWLVWRDGKMSWPLGIGESLSVGRRKDQDIRLADGLLSGQHAVIRNAAIIDLNSTNGTFLNHQKLEPERTYNLRHGDVVGLGQTELIVSGEPAVT